MNRPETRVLRALLWVCLTACFLAASTVRAGTLTVLHTFGGTGDGKYPDTGQLIQVGSVLYGNTFQGGAAGDGTVFSINADGTGYKVLYSFAGADGALPEGIMVNGSTIYGATQGGGANGRGTVFQINTDGTGFGSIYQFPAFGGNNPVNPNGRPALVGGTLYGESSGGGPDGAMYSVKTDGTGFTVLHPFVGGRSDGNSPFGGLIASGATVFGTTMEGGLAGPGTVFSYSSTAGFGDFNPFPLPGPNTPDAALAFDSSTLYGTCASGGPGNGGGVFRMNTDGTGYQVLHSFPANANDGSFLNMPVALAGATLFGVTGHSADGGTVWGTLFSLNTDGTGYQRLFDGSALASPGPVTVVGSTIYGVTNGGGNGFGVIYSFTTPEPSTLTLAAAACLLMGGFAIRHRKRMVRLMRKPD
jgi:uncharacterized repeat protein (TIGR03803 family)